MSFAMSLVGMDRRNVEAAVNQGIDARLEALTNSTFRHVLDGHGGLRLEAEVDDRDLPVLIRRLVEMEAAAATDIGAGMLADDIAGLAYDLTP